MASSAGRRRLPVEDRRQELLRACLALLGERPWDEISMADVARAAGASKPLLYHYFPNRSDLYRAAVRAAADELREASTPPLDLPAPEQLVRALEAHVAWVDANADAYRAVLQGGLSSDVEVQRIIEESRDDVVARLVAGFDLGDPTPHQRILLRGWVGFLEAACLDWLAARDVPRAELVEALVASVRAVVPLARPAGPLRY